MGNNLGENSNIAFYEDRHFHTYQAMMQNQSKIDCYDTSYTRKIQDFWNYCECK